MTSAGLGILLIITTLSGGCLLAQSVIDRNRYNMRRQDAKYTIDLSPEEFDKVWMGRKMFTIKADDGFQELDTLLLREFPEAEEVYTYREILCELRSVIKGDTKFVLHGEIIMEVDKVEKSFENIATSQRCIE